MGYFVEHPGGQRYGPADIPTLNQWAAEGRLVPSTPLIDAANGARLLAQDVNGILFPGGAQGPMMPGPGTNTPLGGYSTPQPIYTPYGAQQTPLYRPGGGSSAVSASYIASFVGLALLCCVPPIGVLAGLAGVGLALSARNVEPRRASGALAFGILTVILNVAATVLFKKLMGGLGGG